MINADLDDDKGKWSQMTPLSFCYIEITKCFIFRAINNTNLNLSFNMTNTNLSESEKKEIYNKVMENISKKVFKSLFESEDDSQVNLKHNLKNILHNWDNLSPEAKNILGDSISKIAELSKTENKSQNVTKQEPSKVQVTSNDEKPLVVPNTNILSKYLNSGNVSKELKEYATQEVSVLNKLLNNVESLGVRKYTPELEKESEEIIRNTMTVKYKFNEQKFNELFTVHTSSSFGDINLLNRSKICEPMQEVIYDMVLNFNFVRVMLEYVKYCIKQNFESGNCNFIRQYGYEKNELRDLISKKLNLSLDDNVLLQRVRNAIAYIWGVNTIKNNAIIKDIKYVDVINLLRICMINAYYVYKMKLMTT